MSYSFKICPLCRGELMWNSEKVRYECSMDGCRWSSPFLYDSRMREKERQVKQRY